MPLARRPRPPAPAENTALAFDDDFRRQPAVICPPPARWREPDFGFGPRESVCGDEQQEGVNRHCGNSSPLRTQPNDQILDGFARLGGGDHDVWIERAPGLL